LIHHLGDSQLTNLDTETTLPTHFSKEPILLVDGKLKRQAVTVIWAEADHYLVNTGLNDGDMLVTTPLSSAVSGTQARNSQTLDNSSKHLIKPISSQTNTTISE